MSDQLPLVGREEELRTAVRALAVDGAVLLTGPSGVGKTRLACEALAAVPHPVVRCYATAATSRIPLGAIASLVPTDLPASQRSILPSSSVRAAAEHLSRGGRRVLSVDDAHLLDDASLLVLQHLVRHRLMRVMCTARPGWGMERLTVIAVDALDRERADALLATALGGPADASTRHLVWTNSRGNPLYLKELVAAGRHRGALTETVGGWHWSGPLELSGRLAELVDLALGRLADPQRRALELLAYGEPLEAGLMSVPQDLVDMGFVRVGDDGRARVAHPLYSARLRATCPTLRARAHRRALADRLESAGRPGDALRVATWRIDSGTAESPGVLARAAEQALSAQDWELAERLARAAVARGATARVGLVLGLVLMYQRQCAQAEDVLAEAMAAGGDTLTLIQVGCTRAFNLFFGLGDEDAAVAVLDLVTERKLSAELEHAVLFFSLTIALEAAPLCVARLGGELLLAEGGWAATAGRQVLAFTDQLAGRYTAAIARTKDNHQAVQATAGRFPSLMNAAQGVHTESMLRSGDLVGAERRAAQALAEVIEEDRWAVTQVPPRVLLSQSARVRGKAASAVRISAEGVPDPAALPMMWDVLLLAELAAGAALQGQSDRAFRALARAETGLRPAWRIARFAVGAARSWVLAGAGRVHEAMQAALHNAALARAHGANSEEIVSLHDAARFGADTSPRLLELAKSRKEPLTTAYASHAQARALRDPAGLEEVAAAFTACGATLYAAEALAEASRLSRLHDRPREADRLERQAAALSETFDGATTPGLVMTRTLAALTPRQLEIARLAVAGLTNVEIAERLAIAKRTVDNHLHTTYAAVGVTGRGGLRELFGHGA
ncbi:LuxR family transcriptional regulator [Lentzea flaviverrucosa]|uniref:ATP-, maltotriose-and DNA-dependent transcriptional regulator MalT n=1 Tax=Lentzea flaviverrucosa TaxID=200379 RepID=A0A1H9XXB8_9PSEU|nr:LuxR family transcriptional regulator [Lentzea flaviverrucosa]RDI17378.1 ATP/maltotriose-dependent transcriptional regulator MalT [Lentzea flaviverrucosa]SES50754.1 ATP-, maltotriose-and DNA-dependent transcriptional regulator MalT [Lentzea flaviverrucosa]